MISDQPLNLIESIIARKLCVFSSVHRSVLQSKVSDCQVHVLQINNRTAESMRTLPMSPVNSFEPIIGIVKAF